MSEMVERVADAILSVSPIRISMGIRLSMARAAIAAMREPTEDMIDAAVMSGSGQRRTLGERIKEEHQAMITEALDGDSK